MKWQSEWGAFADDAQSFCKVLLPGYQKVMLNYQLKWVSKGKQFSFMPTLYTQTWGCQLSVRKYLENLGAGGGMEPDLILKNARSCSGISGHGVSSAFSGLVLCPNNTFIYSEHMALEQGLSQLCPKNLPSKLGMFIKKINKWCHKVPSEGWHPCIQEFSFLQSVLLSVSLCHN